MADVDWQHYLRDFHREHAGITEGVVGHAVDTTGATAYDWLAEAVSADAALLDLACGNGAQAARLPSRERYVGLDVSAVELAGAHHRGLTGLVRGDGTRLPLRDGSFDVVVCSMALMLVPLDATLSEITRVLRPGGLLVATIPASRPLSLVDRVRYARLCLTLRHWKLTYPNDAALRRPQAVLTRYGLDLVDDAARRFVCTIEHPAIGAMLVDSLYLPTTAPRRLQAARQLAARWAGSELGLPIRRLIARLNSTEHRGYGDRPSRS